MKHSNKASDIWDKIQREYIETTHFAGMDLFRKLFHYKFDPNKSVRQQMAQLDNIRG